MLFYRGMTCENVTIKGDEGIPIAAYVAKPSGPGPFPGVVLVHHLPGWSEFYIETTRRFAHHGYLAICANLYERAGQGNPDDVVAKVRADGGISDAQMVGDTEAAVKWMRATRIVWRWSRRRDGSRQMAGTDAPAATLRSSCAHRSPGGVAARSDRRRGGTNQP
jgi:hypothetical protein